MRAVLAVIVVLLLISAAACGGEATNEGTDTPDTTPSSTTTTAALEVEVPNVVGLDLEDASARLRQVGLEPGADDHDPATPGRPVVRQNPAAGSVAQPGSGVTLYTEADGA